MNEEEARIFAEDLVYGYVNCRGSTTENAWTERQIEKFNKLDELSDVCQKE